MIKIKTLRVRHKPFSMLATTIALASAPLAHAMPFKIGEIEGQFDSSLSIGASWSMRDADPDLYGVANGGRAASITADDGRLNFKKGKTFSKIFKGIHDLELKYGDTGIFLRGKYWYDFELKDEHRELYDIDDSNRKMSARASGYELLDAFVYHNYAVGDLPGSVRLGKQVVSWGESVFIQNGINAINPIDVSAFRRPGAEIKEGLIPVNMFYISQSLTNELSAEVFYQLEWDQTVLDNCGTFFSGADGVADGCTKGLAAAGNDYNRDSPNYIYVPREGDRDARDSGQYGVAVRWLAEDLNSTEFGFYAMNYHSRTPILSANITTANPLLSPAFGLGSASYVVEYPEDIRLYGVSFQTNIGDASVAGEVSYRPNMPLQINSTDLIATAINAGPFLPTQLRSSGIPGDYIAGYQRKPVTQAQVSVTRIFDQLWGADRLVTIGEVGYNHIADISQGSGDEVRFGRSPIYGSGEYTQNALLGPNVCATLLNTRTEDCNSDGFYTRNSWGYRLRAALEYNNVFAGINLTPSIAWSHDVEGYGPNFTEHTKAISIGLSAEYLNTYTASISYTDFFGGKYNTLVDRDFLSATVGVNF
ncbi:DUF1302 domain-containing protein [Pseudomonas chlororaphis]|uniref:DUF1302 domain-containing protein n=1 Tax=Pseudomonas chlororaphis TaxID=587753 RepID=UPI003B66D210|nr:hypothetical protein [Pseudomonas chlororaphis]MCP1594560.1 hypothetical protein [Pseudomonas chlororaphis]